MTIFIYNIKRILKDRVNLIFMIILPTVFIGLMMFSSFELGLPKVGIIDGDNTRLTRMIGESLKGRAQLVNLKEEDVKSSLINSKADYIVEIDRGFTEKLINGENPELNSYSIKEANVSGATKFYIQSFLNSAENIALSVKGDENRFYQLMEEYEKGSYEAKYISVGDNSARRVNTLQGLGFLVMGMLLLSSFGSTIILKDKANKTYYRVFTTPVTVKNYMFQSILSFLAVSVIQIIIVFSITIFLLKGDLGPSIFNMFIIFLSFSLVCTALGVWISSISKDKGQANALLTLIITPICMLGGCYWPRDIMPELLQKIGNFLPTTWIIRAAEKIIYGASLRNVTTEISILLLFALVFFLMGTWRKTDIAK